VLDADKEGFLRSQVSLIQTIGRAARHLQGRVILYADQVTDSMRSAIDETRRRRAMQEEFNRDHGITPSGVKKAILDLSQVLYRPEPLELAMAADNDLLAPAQVKALIEERSREMTLAAEAMEFERAAVLRDQVLALKDMDLGLKPPSRTLLEAPAAHRERPGTRRRAAARGARRR